MVPTSCGKLPTNIGTPAGGSLTADQWLLLATVYGPVVLWSACLPEDARGEALHAHVQTITKAESEKQAHVTQRAEHAKALLEAKKQGEGAYEAMKLKIAQDKLKVAKAKNQEKLQIVAAKQVEKATMTAAKKAKAAQARLVRKCKATHKEQLSHPLSMQANEEESSGAIAFTDEDNGKFSLHPNDLDNFLKLCSALHILLRQ
ncbi:hypothetical protein M404DRAFT_24567 [Pisolithus tinctorius Marx 270]|uniref:Uncharacterized protein n=1 Tax=Pisolithus tinctorius Marx 270 TaxID=870435 RepID=A0A0C3JB41_PISTI|nr:hypothetical protein M404DRAFT_24567 [Pisolithus tinctorius Marx 270]